MMEQQAVEPFHGLLSDREREILHLMSMGEPDKTTAHILRLSKRTIDTHAAHILRKLKAKNRAHAVAIAFRIGLLKV